jgi:hypothetical protein
MYASAPTERFMSKIVARQRLDLQEPDANDRFGSKADRKEPIAQPPGWNAVGRNETQSAGA